MNKIFPTKLNSGDTIAIIAPSRSLGIIGEETKKIANERFSELGLKVIFGKQVDEIDDFASSSIESRISDLHAAFADNNVNAILTVIGGFNSNQLLKHIDWNLIKNNPKILCGYSDITALNNAFFAKTGLVTYSGPHYSTFGQKLHFDYTLKYFKKCLMFDEPFRLEPSNNWSDDAWYKNQDDRKLVKNDGYFVVNPGEAQGTLLGANLCTFNLLQGTEFMPNLKDSILFIEDDSESHPYAFDRDLQSVIHQPGFDGVNGIVIGRFQNESKMTYDLLSQIIKSKKELQKLPVIAGVDFGHTDPKITFPVGGTVKISANTNPKIEILEH